MRRTIISVGLLGGVQLQVDAGSMVKLTYRRVDSRPTGHRMEEGFKCAECRDWCPPTEELPIVDVEGCAHTELQHETMSTFPCQAEWEACAVMVSPGKRLGWSPS